MKVRKIIKGNLLNEVEKLRKNKRLIAVTATVEGNDYNLFYQFDDKNGIYILKIIFSKKENHIASIINIFPSANIMERELHDLFGIEFDGNPNMSHKLFLAEDWEDKPPRSDS